jgi:hypothetical protein
MKVPRRVKRAWYYLRSFFRWPWTFADYPVVVHRQGPLADGALPEYVAMIDGMILAGLGDTPESARAELAERFEAYRAAHDTLPRPGTQAPITFATATRVELHGTLRDEFVERILRMEWAFMSDESSLTDFPEELDEYGRRIMLLYGIDIDQLADRRIATILDAIADRPARGGRV